MSIQASAATAVTLPPLRLPAAAPFAKHAPNAPVAKNDADGDLQTDLATGENPYASIGSNVNIKA
jgi:hypothetical protein